MDEFEKRKRQQQLKTGRKQGDPMPRKLKGGGISQRGLGKAFKKGGRAK